MTRSGYIMKWAACRRGQELGVTTILRQTTSGARYTPIILPTRYGKSDVMRIATVLLWHNGIIPCALAMSPNAVLRDQLNSDTKWAECIGRYELPNKGFKKRTLLSLETDFTRNGEAFVSTTTQLVNRNADVFAKWVESIIHKTGKRPIVFMDECHTGSEDNSWGETVVQLAEAGAHVVLMTATAMRSDGRRIPGFDFETVAEEPVNVTITRPGSLPELIRVEMYEGQKRLLRLRAQPPTGHETTFREAWAEDPSPLCKVGRVPFDVDVSAIVGRDEERRLLSEIDSVTETRRLLGKVVRARVVISEGAERLVTELRRYKTSCRDIAGIVFCGNDQDDEDEKSINKHANAIRLAIESLAPELTVLVATSADSGKERIEAFAKGAGDVLIVKQMASLGLDVPRMKIALDLSPVRTPAAFVQRLMRVATPYGNNRHCCYIAPDDVVGRALFNGLISDSNGAATVTDLELIRAYEKERGDSTDTPLYTFDGTANAPFQDSRQNYAEADRFPVAQALLESFPELLTNRTHAEIAQIAERFGLVPRETPPITHVEDTGLKMDGLRSDINESAKSITISRMVNVGYSQQEYAEVIKDVFLRAYRTVGLPTGTRLSAINDLGLLAQIRTALHNMQIEKEPVIYEVGT